TMANMNIPANDAPAEQAHAFWDTMCFNSSTGLYSCQLDEQWFNIHKDILRDALDITPTNDNNPFVAPPSSDTVIEYVNTLGYLSKITGFDKPRHLVLQILWGRILLRLLVGRRRPLICSSQALGAPYYGEYQEHVAKYQQHLDAEHGKAVEGGATESFKATKETPNETSPAKRSKGGLVRNIRKPMSSLKLVDEPSAEDVPVEQPAYNEEEANL
nr:hypothetical protein [Tanacetum cinerariifolium]